MEPVLTLMHDSTSVRLSITGTSAGSMPVKVHITFSVDRYSGLYTLFSNDLEILGGLWWLFYQQYFVMYS